MDEFVEKGNLFLLYSGLLKENQKKGLCLPHYGRYELLGNRHRDEYHEAGSTVLVQ